MKLTAIGKKLGLMLAAVGIGLMSGQSFATVNLAQSPLFLANPARPIVMLNMSNDHQLYFKAYDDYTDLTGDGRFNTTYTHEYDYYGYFDSGLCYEYDNEENHFAPESRTDDGYCDGTWSGNFLNWATMTRMDAVRKILYGGYRSTDTSDATVLERVFLPSDAHSFAKYYNGTDIGLLTPFSSIPMGLAATEATGITLCNTTPNDGQPPEIRVVKGNYSLWASNERWQCRWQEENSNWGDRGVNGNDSELSGIYAYGGNPHRDTATNWRGQTVAEGHGLGDGSTKGTFVARVKVCVTGLEEENCRSYPDGNTKPTGVLQQYGERGDIHFGLMTGSYTKNKSGGVLRKNVGSLADEIAVNTDGQFLGTAGIIDTLNKLRIYGYNYGTIGGGGNDDGTYNSSSGDNCEWGKSSFNDGQCSNWGNPQSEIYLESLRYLAGKSATPTFNVVGNDKISGLRNAAWAAPISSDNYCAATNVIQFNASVSSYDEIEISTNDIGLTNLDEWTNVIGGLEGIHGNDFFVGEVGDDAVDDQLCTPKTISSLADAKGTCPDAPRLEGSYDMAGLAHFARRDGLAVTDVTERVNVKTYGVSLAPAIPRVDIPVGDQLVTLLPACRSIEGTRLVGNCAIVDFKVVEQRANGGRLYVNWEDSEQGGDFDQDMWGIIDYSVADNVITVTTNVINESALDKMGFGYVISGTQNDGFHVHSGASNFRGGECERMNNNSGCQVSDGPTSRTYTVGSGAADLLEPPLYYAAKWGGYAGDELTPEEVAALDPETYFYATEPRELEESLKAVLDNVADEIGSASAVAANSTSLGTDTVLYQALFDSRDWSGEIKAIRLNSDGSLSDELAWSTKTTEFPSPNNRNIVTYDGHTGVPFTWDAISEAQRTELGSRDTLRWMRGENIVGLRERNTLLGDIVNSNPVYAASEDHRFHNLPATLGGRAEGEDRYGDYVRDVKNGRQEVLYIGSNGGMMHALNAQTGQEIFAYVPSIVYDKLENLTKANYGLASNLHHYTVDGPIFVGDAYFTHNGVTKWRNILVGTLGAGGRGLYVLDVSNPSSFNESNVLFELTAADIPELGNITGQPIVAPTSDGWKIFVGNGYNSDNGRASLIVVDLDNPMSDTVVLNTDTTGGNGLAEPALLPNGQGVITHAYAGDLQGRMWRFDLTPGDWKVSFDGDPLFEAQDVNGRVQPITAAPTLGRNAQKNNATMVYFGTGSYLTQADNQTGNTVQSFYALADTGTRIASTNRSELLQKSIVEEGPSQGSENPELQGRTSRQISNNDNTEWWAEKRGWYLDLWYDNEVTGERVVSKPQLLFDKVLFPTLITSNHACSMGGSGWLMELTAVGDRYVNHSILGEDGLALDYAVLGLSNMIYDGGNLYIPVSDISGQINIERGTVPGTAYGRMSWRQLR